MKYLDGIAPRGFRVAHGVIGVPQQLRCAAPIVWKNRDADAGGDENLASAAPERRAQRIQILRCCRGCSYRKLIAADASRDIVRSGKAPQSIAGRSQQFVADRVAQRSVNLFESIQVDEENAQAVVAPSLKRTFEKFDEMKALWQAR